jgi:hypothetical protein
MQMQVIEAMYEEMSAAVPREAMALKATVLPIFMRERRMVMQKEMRTELSGMSQPGRTYSPYHQCPHSYSFGVDCAFREWEKETYMCQKLRKR